MKDDVTQEESDRVRYGLIQFVNDKNVFLHDRFSIEAMFKMMGAPATAFAYFISAMVLALAFFMMTVSFS